MATRRTRSWWSLVGGGLLVLGSAALFLVVWWKLPLALYAKTAGSDDARLKAITDTRTALLAGLVGVGALLTFWLNSQLYRLTTRAFELTEQGHITERYTKAIEQLGSDKLDVRLGGIYALTRIAVDSERDHPAVVEVLSAFVREHSRSTNLGAESGSVRSLGDRAAGYQPVVISEQRPRPTIDVQAAVTVLGQLPLRAWSAHRADLAGAHLAGVELTGNLSDANLSGVNLSGALLIHLNLSEADLSRADLSGASLISVNLTDTNLYRVNLSGAKLSGTIGLTRQQLLLARADAQTRLPSGLQRPPTDIPSGLFEK